jgi:hypothetical protein
LPHQAHAREAIEDGSLVGRPGLNSFHGGPLDVIDLLLDPTQLAKYPALGVEDGLDTYD